MISLTYSQVQGLVFQSQDQIMLKYSQTAFLNEIVSNFECY